MRLLKIVANKRTAEFWKINDECILNYFTCLSCMWQMLDH
jgi:hypothetical protein